MIKIDEKMMLKLMVKLMSKIGSQNYNKSVVIF
jgi:hypothetical protein